MARTYLKLLKYYLATEPKTPVQLIHFVTSRCNAKCKHCFFWSKLNAQDELSLEEIDKLSKTIPDLIILNISGGEPFIRKDFAEIIKTYYRNTQVKTVAVPTNGILTEKIIRDCKEILSNCPKLDLNIVLSLDGPEVIHDDIRQVENCFQTAVKTFHELKALKTEYPNMQLSVVSTLTSLNQEKLEELHNYVNNQLKPDVFSLNLIRGEAKKMEMFDVDMNNYRKFFQLQSNSAKKGVKAIIRDYMNKLRTGVILETVEKKKFILPCKAGTLMAVMYENGDIYPCELLNRQLIGNIREYDFDFKKLWSSEKAKKAYKLINDTKCYCTHECFQRFNIFYNSSFVAKHFFKNLAGRSEIVNALEINRDGNDSSEAMINIGKIRGVRCKPEAGVKSDDK